MANTISTDLIEVLYEQLAVGSREMIGALPACTLSASSEMAAKGQEIVSANIADTNSFTVTPAMTPPTPADRTFTGSALVIDDVIGENFAWSDNDVALLGTSFRSMMQNSINQAIRKMANAIESNICSKAALAASAAWLKDDDSGKLFTTDMTDLSFTAKLLNDRGAGMDRALILGTTGAAYLGAQTNLSRVSEAGTTSFLQQGIMAAGLYTMDVRQSAGVVKGVTATGSGYLVNHGGGYAIGDVAITLDTGTGTIPAGSIVGFGDGEFYVVKTALAANVVVLQAPGLRAAIANDAPLTVYNATAYDANFAFSRDAIVVATRMPVRTGQDQALDVVPIVDPNSGITFEFAKYPGYYKAAYQLTIAHGAAVMNPEHLVLATNYAD